MVEKQLPFTSRTVDLSKKSEEFKIMYKTIHPDHQASAKVPILEVGFPGEKDYVQLVESAVCTKYVATAWPYRGSDLLPAWPGLLGDVHAREALSAARIDLFVDLYMGNVVPGYYRLMKAKKKSELKKHYEKFLHALVKVDNCLRMHGCEDGGPFFIGYNFTLAECLTAPFVVRMLANLPFHRSIDIFEDCRSLNLMKLFVWLEAVRDRESLALTSPSIASLSEPPKAFVEMHLSKLERLQQWLTFAR
jgi:glutathione S-transferase